MSFSASAYIQKLANAQHSDNISTYSALNEVLKAQSIYPQSFAISRQQFFDQPVTQLTSDGQRYTRAPLGARGTGICSMVQTCQVNWQITIPACRLALQINKTHGGNLDDMDDANARVNFTGDEDMQFNYLTTMQAGADGDTQQQYKTTEHIKFWLGYSTACGPFQQFAICKDNTKLWDTSIYAREQAVISANSLSDLCTNNSVSVSPLESIAAGKRHCGIFIDIPVEAFSATAGRFNYLIPYPITFSGVLDLNQLNPIFNSFPVLTRNYASLYLQLWTQDFLQDLKIVWLNKTNMVTNEHLAYQMIPPEKPDIIFLRNRDNVAYNSYAVRIVNMEGKPHTEKFPTSSISQIKDAKFDKLDISNISFNMENEEAIKDLIRAQKIINFPTQIIRTQSSNFPFGGFDENGGNLQSIMSFANIKAMYMTFAMNQYPTWFFPVLLQRFDLIVDQRHLTPEAYSSLNPMVCGQMFDCFVDQDVIAAPSDLNHSLTFENQSINESDKDYYGRVGAGYLQRENIFYQTTLYRGSKATKVYYPNKFMLAWKMATDDSFMRGYNSSKMGARTNIQVTLQGSLTPGINESSLINPGENQNNHLTFCGTRCHPNPRTAQITPLMHYLCDAIVRVTFDDASDPQVLTLEVIGEMGGTMVRAG
ncbi:MAG: hypothetical protein EZS28_011740 [Streblomastix strix]|uniref:Uncharacterized protein n=1 Tax=Streblomastix strix TaxID=222440 RepID=A0A5J4WE71_9EUKA|nr:MAG: hypothetical protein EZS28_011740 [Streblomastix strix]